MILTTKNIREGLTIQNIQHPSELFTVRKDIDGWAKQNRNGSTILPAAALIDGDFQIICDLCGQPLNDETSVHQECHNREQYLSDRKNEAIERLRFISQR